MVFFSLLLFVSPIRDCAIIIGMGLVVGEEGGGGGQNERRDRVQRNS